MMDHMRKNHIEHTGDKSMFLPGLNMEAMIDGVLKYPAKIKQDEKRTNRCWYASRFCNVIGHRGYDGAQCQWLAVLLEEDNLLTTDPVPHQQCLQCFH